MKKAIIYGLLFVWIFILNGCSTSINDKTSENEIVLLNSDWTFTELGKDSKNPADVPGTVHTDLLALNKIPDPYYRLNEEKLQWIDKKDWQYSTTFYIDSSQANAPMVLLKFYGIDTYSKIKLNGNELLETDNMFRTWEIDVKDYIKIGENQLEVILISPIKKGLQLLENNGYPLPAANDQSELGGLENRKVSVFTRKAPYHYGWDWGPRLVTSGIWRPVELHFVNQSQIKDVYYRQIEVTEEEAKIVAETELNILTAGSYIIEIKNKYTGKVLAKSLETLAKGNQKLDISFTIRNPKLWWPNGYGHQNLYAFNLKLRQKKDVLSQRVDYIGLRDIKLIREADSTGASFYFQVNDVPVFAKGANYIPSDNFLPRVTKERYCKLIKSAIDANMNMLRVWGGGLYEDDDFYTLCDKNGILVWQDFMFACSMYPGDSDFLDNVRLEVMDNIKRLRNHTSIALWCGNNEIDAAWYQGDTSGGWKWKELYSQKVQASIWHAYDTLFHTILPKEVEEIDGTREYWPSSPIADWGKHASYTTTSGDMHYWGVWLDKEPFESFSNVKARFMSEYGFQSFPEFSTIMEFTLPQDWSMQSYVMKSHQRSPSGTEKIKEYMQRYFPVPKDFKGQLYMGQLLQAYGIKMAIDEHRISKPYTMGSLYWQFNDCWPAASWSGIDYFGRRKALHYFVKDAYKQTALAFSRNKNDVQLYVLNDNPELNKAHLIVKQKDFSGNEKELFNSDVDFSFESSTSVFNISIEEAGNFAASNESFLVAQLETDRETIDEELFYFVIPKNLQLAQAKPQLTIENLNNTQTKLWIYSDKLIKNMAITLKNKDANISDNYFDIQPDETKEIDITSSDETKIELTDIQIEMLNNFISNKR